MSEEELAELAELRMEIGRIASAIRPRSAAPGPGANHGHIDSLTEAVMDLSVSAKNIGYAIESVASAIESMAEALRKRK